MSKLNFCVWCGYKLDHTEKFCPKCGSNLLELKDEEEPVPVEEPQEEPKVPEKELTEYEIKINELKEIYDEKEEKALDLINKSFNPQEITYSKFVDQLNRNHEAFYKQVELGLNLNGMLGIFSDKVELNLNKTIEEMEKMLDQLQSLIIEFIINPIYDKKSKQEITTLHKDMDDLIDSVKYYQ